MMKQGLACAVLASALLFSGGSEIRDDKFSEKAHVAVCVAELETLDSASADEGMISPVPARKATFAPDSGEYVTALPIADFDENVCESVTQKPLSVKLADVVKEAAKAAEEEKSEPEKTEKTEKTDVAKKESTSKADSSKKENKTDKKSETKTETVKIPSPLTDEQFALMLAEAKKYLGYDYVWGGSTPETSFDCSGYVCWVVNNSGIGMNIGRINSKSIYKLCTKVSSAELKPGDLVFFKGTYETSGVSHVGIYIGGGKMIHCGSSVAYADLSDNYWRSHFYAYGRLPNT